MTEQQRKPFIGKQICYVYFDPKDGKDWYAYGILWSGSVFASKDDPDDYIWIRSEDTRPLKYDQVSWDIDDVHPMRRMRKEKIVDWSKVSVVTKEE